MKTCEEWSLEFDLLYNNIASDKAPGLNEYEKSVFLTRAQETIVVALYKGSLGDSFESTEEAIAYLDVLVKQADCVKADKQVALISSYSTVFQNPEDLLFRTWEGCKIHVANCGDVDAQVIPVTQDEYWRTIRNPFKGPNNRKVLRLAYATGSAEGSDWYGKTGYSELVSKSPIVSYTVRYVAHPEPIILTDLPDGLSINGVSVSNTCKLDEALHHTILTEAVRLAKAAWAA